MVITKIAGFAMEMTLAALYGAGTIADAFVLAHSIPLTLMPIITIFVLNSYIPMYFRVTDKIKFTRNIMTLLLIVGLFISLVFTFFPDSLVRLFGFRLPPETFDVAVFFMRYMAWVIVFAFFSGIYDSYLQANEVFFSSGVHTVFQRLAIILGLILGYVSGYNLLIALAPAVGNALSMMFLAARCKKYGYVYKPYMNTRSSELKQLIILGSPVFFIVVFNQINAIISRNFAASLPVGSISHLNYSNGIAMLFTATVGAVLTVVLFPHMSRLVAENNSARANNALTSGITFMTLFILPICAGLFILAEPGVRILFQRGAFTPEDTIRTAACLRMFTIFIYTQSINALIVRAFNAVNNTKTPTIISVVALAIGIFLQLLLMRFLAAEGLALAASLTSLLAMILLLAVLQKKLGRLGLREKLPEFAKIAAATGFMGLGLWYVAKMLPLMTAPLYQSILLCIAIVIVAAIVYGVLLLLMRSKVAHDSKTEIIKLISK